MDFDVKGARAAGYTDAEIADHLAGSEKFDVGAARDAGYSDSEIVNHLALGAGGREGVAKGSDESAYGRVKNAAASALNGLLFGWGDEATAGLKAAAPFISGTGSHADTFDQRYQENLKSERTRRETYAGAHPVESVAANVGGALLTAPLLPAAATATVPRAIGTGAALGALQGFGEGEGGFANRLQSAATGAAIGGAGMGALGVAGKAFPWLTSLASGVSPEAQALARQAGREGGANAETFIANMKAPDRAALVDMLDQGIDAVKAAGQQKYLADMARIGQNGAGKPLSYAPIDQALQSAAGSLVHAPTGFVKDPHALGVVHQMAETVAQHKALPGQTADVMSFDALKQALGHIWKRQPYGSNERRVAGEVYNAVKTSIDRQDQTYAIAMHKYSTMKDEVDQVRSMLGNPDKVKNVDTIVGRLLSTLRNDVSSRYGARRDALDIIAQHQPELPYAIAGQTMHEIMPRGLVARAWTAAKLDHGLANLPNLATLPAASPRVVGNVNYRIGQMQGAMPNVAIPGLNAAQNQLLNPAAPFVVGGMPIPDTSRQ